MSPDVSVIICNYNNARYIGRAIRSCLKQTLDKNRYEIVVVDDCSTDESREVISSFADSVKPIFLVENKGVAEASNVGIKHALGRFIIRVDADDYISPLTLQFLLEILEQNPDIGFVYSDHLRVDDDERVLKRINLDTLNLLTRHGAGIMFRKSYMEAIGLYKPELRNAEDYDLIKRYIKNWDGFHLPIPLYRYRLHDMNMTRDEESRKKWETQADENNR